jgi:CubicO group peptidase (beta-lactamase class C family)
MSDSRRSGLFPDGRLFGTWASPEVTFVVPSVQKQALDRWIEGQMRFVILTILLFTSLLQAKGQHVFENIDEELTGMYERQAFSGSVLVAKEGKIIYRKSVGLADREHRISIGPTTKFELASLSKVFTAVLVLQLAESGKINLYAPISEYVPELTRSDSGNITVHHLLSHTSGIQDFVGLNCPFAGWTRREFMEGLNKTPIAFKAGSRFEYASSTYVLLRFIIEQVTGHSYEENIRDHIFGPAGMTESGIVKNNEILSNRAMGYVGTPEGYTNALPIANHDIFLGAASVYSTATDLLKFDQALYTERLLSADLKEKMFTIVEAPYGYGWFISYDSATGKIVSHGGDIFGYTSLIERRLRDKTLILILSNQQSVEREAIVKLLDKTLH